MESRQLAKVQWTFANISIGPSPIGEAPLNFRQYLLYTFANNWRKSYWRSSEIPIWAAYCHITVNRTNRGHQVCLYSFIACMTHLLTDYIVHQPDMAPYPNAHTKYGLSLWQYLPIISWIGELLLILVAIRLTRARYGADKVRLPMIIMICMHLMNYPGLFTNIPYTLGKIFQNHYSLLRLNVSLVFLAVYLIPGLFISQCLDETKDK